MARYWLLTYSQSCLESLWAICYLVKITFQQIAQSTSLVSSNLLLLSSFFLILIVDFVHFSMIISLISSASSSSMSSKF